jgi:hypothetical protein
MAISSFRAPDNVRRWQYFRLNFWKGLEPNQSREIGSSYVPVSSTFFGRRFFAD